MGSKIILSNREDIKVIEAEEQLNFVLAVLQASGISEENIENCFSINNDSFSVENKIALRKLCEKEKISIVDNVDGSLQIYMRAENENVLVAEWFKPKYTLRIDNSILDRSKRSFVEIYINWWTIFEEVENEKK